MYGSGGSSCIGGARGFGSVESLCKKIICDIYIYIYRERERYKYIYIYREREIHIHIHTRTLHIHTRMYIYIYIYIYICKAVLYHSCSFCHSRFSRRARESRALSRVGG